MSRVRTAETVQNGLAYFFCQVHVAFDGDYLPDEGQFADGSNLFGRSHDGSGVEPAALPHPFGGKGVDLLHIALIQRVVTNIVEVSLIDLVSFDSLGIEITVRVKGRASLVGQHYPVAPLRMEY